MCAGTHISSLSSRHHCTNLDSMSDLVIPHLCKVLIARINVELFSYSHARNGERKTWKQSQDISHH